MDCLLRIVEESSAPEIEIDEERLREFLKHVKVWDFVKMSQDEYQSLSAAERFSILKDYYSKMCQKYGSGKWSILFFFYALILFVHEFCLDFFLCSYFFYLVSSPRIDFGIESAASFVIKKANVITLTKETGDISNKTVLRVFPHETSGEKVGRKNGYFGDIRLDYNMEKANFPEKLLIYINQSYLIVQKLKKKKCIIVTTTYWVK